MPTTHIHDNIIVLSVGGSLIVPKSGIDAAFLKDFRAFILRQIKKGRRFIIVTGGGRTAREYQNAADAVLKPTDEDMDWLGIHASRLNAQLFRNIFRDVAQHVVVKNPTRKITWNRHVLLAAGWKPGRSTDAVAVQLAHAYGSRLVINLSNIDRVYDKDPYLHEDARPLKTASWHDFRKLVGHKWSPGANAPFDPVASRFAEKWGMTVAVMGKSLTNVAAYLDGKKFTGTILT
jgi:uridylate kinase